MDLRRELACNVGQACIVNDKRIRAVTAEDNFVHPQAFASAENCPNVVSGADIVSDNNYFAHVARLYHL